MGEFSFAGPDAASNLQHLTTNDVSRLSPGQAQYTLLCNEQGGIVDDVILYRLEDDVYLMVVNAANIEKIARGSGATFKAASRCMTKASRRPSSPCKARRLRRRWRLSPGTTSQTSLPFTAGLSASAKGTSSSPARGTREKTVLNSTVRLKQPRGCGTASCKRGKDGA